MPGLAIRDITKIIICGLDSFCPILHGVSNMLGE
jgi:hypothetical protein